MSRIAPRLPALVLAAASLILAAEPLRWLLRSWQDPAYQSHGAWYVAALALAVGASLASGPAAPARRGDGLLVIFAAAASLRLAGQVLAVNVLSALALAVDVYALARLMRLDLRPRALSPGWLAAFFLFALPLGPILERVLGFPLQRVSAEIACGLLSPFFADLACEGVRLRVGGLDVLVDLPCAGASGLLLLLALWCGMNAVLRPRPRAAALALGAVLACALLGNGLRIALLAAGLARGLDVMAPAPHEAIGALTLALSALPLLLLYRPAPVPPRPGPRLALPPRARLPLALASLGAAALIVAAPEEPVDRSGAVARLSLPAQLMGQAKVPEALTPVERFYFAAHGGVAQKARYGALGLNVVQTGAPLRHLHAPATCLLGMGYDVAFLGTRFEPVPTSVYRATGPDGRAWIVSVSFVSGDGHATASVGEAVWSWLTDRSAAWTSVQRITPASLPAAERAALERAALAALDI